MRRGDDRSEAESPLEPECEVDKRRDEAEQDGDERFLLELTADLGAHALVADHRVRTGAELRVERLRRGGCDVFGLLLTRAARVEPRANDEVARRAERLDLGLC